MTYRTLNPATGKEIKTYDAHSDAQLDQALERAREAFPQWRGRTFHERAGHFRKLARLLEGERRRLAELMALEMGKPAAQGRAEAEKCAWVCRFYADKAEEFLAPEERESDAGLSLVRYDPLGPVLAVMPWNFPFWQLFRFGAPSLMAGNVALLKHAPNTPGCGEEIEGLFRRAGFPAGVLQNLRLSNEQAASAIGDPRLRGVTLTGSSRAGRQVASAAGSRLKPMVLELGGSDPFIVLEDADLKEAVEAAVAARCQNSGQSCIAAKRFLVHSALADDFTQAFVEAMRAQKMGDPLDEGTDLGPQARKDLRENLHRQVEESRQAGARLLCGGRIPDGDGFFYPATVLDKVPDQAAAWREELFGPVAAVAAFETERQAIDAANSSSYGLGASLWTASRERARRLAPQIESGAVFVNGMVKSDPRLPFGGVKESGFGRELSAEGAREFTNVKTVWIK